MSDTCDLIVRGATLVLPTGLVRADLAAAEGRITRIGPGLDLEAKGDDRCFRALCHGGHHRLARAFQRARPHGMGGPGLGLGVPGGRRRHGLLRHAAQLAAPCHRRGEPRAKAGCRRALLAHGLWHLGRLVPGNIDHLEAMRDAGAIGFKSFMCNSGVEEFQRADPETLRAGMKRAASLGMLVAVHAEDEDLARVKTAEAHARGTDVRTWLTSRPVELELRAIRTAVDIAGETGCSLHIVHVSSPEGVALAREGRKAGVDVSIETCPHYLLLTEEDVVRPSGLPRSASRPCGRRRFGSGSGARCTQGASTRSGPTIRRRPPT
jgi:allantoinase